MACKATLFTVAVAVALVLVVLLPRGDGVTSVNASRSDAGSPDDDDSCFCRLHGPVDDCACSVDAVDAFNNQVVFDKLKRLLRKPYFRYFNYNPNRPCPFWDLASVPASASGARCSSGGCGVHACSAAEIPSGLVDCVDGTLGAQAEESLQRWLEHDASEGTFCEVDADVCAECVFVDLARNPERYTGYSGQDARRVWSAIYEENCFSAQPESDVCLEKRAFFRAVSGLHSSITVHLTANYPHKQETSNPFSDGVVWSANATEFERRFHPRHTAGQGPLWLRNIYFVYLLELRALSKAASYLDGQAYYTGRADDDAETRAAVTEILTLCRSFPNQFDESAMFADHDEHSLSLKRDFRTHFHNISRIMDCVGCDKCKLWGKLQVTGLGTALKILFSTPPASAAGEEYDLDYRLSRNEIVSLFNAFGKIATSIHELQNFKKKLRR